MSGCAPAYIGRPPPHWKRKWREWEQRAREREEQERELSPAVPDPPITPSRSAIFGSPEEWARVYKTYAHKRARSRASSVADEPDDAQHGASRESFPEPSPTKVPNMPAYSDLNHPSTRTRRAQSGAERQVANPSSVAGPSSSRSPNIRPRPSSLTVFVEISHRRHPPPAQSKAAVAATRVEPSRGRSHDTKGITLPSPSPTSEENADPRPRKRVRLPEGPSMSLSEALNRSFAGANSSHPSPIGATPASFTSLPLPAAGPSASPDSNAFFKRKPGRPRGRGRGRGLAPMDPVVPHSALSGATGHVATSRMHAPPLATGSEVASSSRAQPVLAEGETESAGEDIPPVIPAKRPRGRPRKDSALPPPSRASSRPRRSVSRRRSSQQEQQSSDAAAVADQLTQDFDTPSQVHLQQSVDVLPVAMALQEQAMREGDQSSSSAKRPRGRPKGSKNRATLEREASARATTETEDQAMQEVESSHLPRPRGRPKGSKNRSTLEREALARAASELILSTNPIVPAPAPVKRGPGRPRKSAPNPPTVPLADTMDYMEPLKDPDAEDVPHPSTLHPGRRGRSRTRRNSTPAAPSPAYYLDTTTLQWKPRARSASASPSKRQVKTAEGTNEYQTSARLCAALKQELLQAPHPKTKETQTPGQDDAPRVARSGADRGEDAPKVVFSGCWEVVADKNAVCDDALALKILHDVVKRLGICINFGDEGPIFARSEDGSAVAIAVPCGCLSLQERSSPSGSADASSPPPECAGEMTVSITEKETERFPGAKAHRIIVTVMH
ncbi:hypothetical protein C8T65DRAFT_246961 [Cerioporus squamosus]|nr:hypothetical protein C8T65DRAFT_246961 [Cerioporus squamosus]